MTKDYVVVFGGCNVDISGKSTGAVAWEDSNPGRVTLTPGGVGRNIAANLALVGVDTELVTAFGEDLNKELILAEAPKKLGFSHSLTVEEADTGSYLAVLDEAGEMVVAINDMDVIASLTPDVLKKRRALAEGASHVVVDANLTEEALREIFSWDVPVIVDGVSAIKVLKFKPFLSRIHVLKCNVLEAQALSGIDGGDINRIGKRLADRSPGYVLITAGGDGAYLFEGTRSLHFKTSPMTVAGATGAGDAFLGMLTAELARNRSIVEATVGAMAASRMVLKSDASDLTGFDVARWEREKEEISYDN